MKKVYLFLDTNVILDYLENRDYNVKYTVEKMIRSERISLSTSVFNIIELLDKEKDITYIGKLMLNKYSFDEILSMKSQRNLSDDEKNQIADKINKFILNSRIDIYELEDAGYETALKLIRDYDFHSQDALIVATALSIDVDYFVSNDSKLIKELKENKILRCFNLKEEIDRKLVEKLMTIDENANKRI